MDTLTVTLVIRMTGLLLLTPADAHGGRPTYVLVPQTHQLAEAHSARLGYRAQGCPSRTGGICWLDMNDWSYQVAPGASHPGPAHVSHANITRITGVPVPQNLFGPQPGAALKSRVMLYGGEVTDSCALARWSIRNDTVTMPNVIEWTIRDVPESNLMIIRTPLHQPGARPDTIPLRPLAGQPVELFIGNIPEVEWRGGWSPHPALSDTATHFHAVYDLLNAPHGQRYLPVYRGRTGEMCSPMWPVDRPQYALQPAGARDHPSPTTVSCMIGSGFPG